MTDKEKLKKIALEYEQLLIRYQNGIGAEMRALYKQLNSELTIILDALEGNDLQLISKTIKNIQKKFVANMNQSIYSRVEYIQKLSYKKFLAEVPILLNIGLNADDYKRALELYTRNIPTRINKKYISNRIWNINKVYFNTLQDKLQEGIFSGTSAKDLAKVLKDYINSPLPQGQGIYRSAEKNAVRLARTEIKRAYQLKEHEQIKQLPFVTGVRVNLSGAHPEYDMCDELQGVYPPEFQFGGWHPSCICFTTFERVEKEEAKKIIQEGTQAKPVQMPDNYFKYLNDHKERYLEKPPLFLTENLSLSKKFF